MQAIEPRQPGIVASAICALCARPDARTQCARCGVHAYCGAECMLAHATTHASWCLSPSTVRTGARRPLAEVALEAWRSPAAPLSVAALRALRPRALLALAEGGVLTLVVGPGAACVLAPRLLGRVTEPLAPEPEALSEHPRLVLLVHTLLVLGRARRIDERVVAGSEPLAPGSAVMLRARVFYGDEGARLDALQAPIRVDGTDADPVDGAAIVPNIIDDDDDNAAAAADDDDDDIIECGAQEVEVDRGHARAERARARNARSVVLDLVLERLVPGYATVPGSGAPVRRACVRAHVRALGELSEPGAAVRVSSAQLHHLLL